MSSPSDLKSAHSEYEIENKGNITFVKIPATYVDEPLTEEQKEKLLEFEEEFILRYTDDDKEYVATKTLGSTTPPLIPSYRPFRNFRRDNNRQRNSKRSGDDDQRSYDNDQRNYKNRNSSHNQHAYGYNNYYRR
jgi:hypothetical protein